jgi:hypothetical protein
LPGSPTSKPTRGSCFSDFTRALRRARTNSLRGGLDLGP